MSISGDYMKIFLLISATFIWGLGFVGTRWTLFDYSFIWSNSLRFAFAGALVAPILLFKWDKKNTTSSFICALLLIIGLQLQTIGIGLTTLAKSGFLTVFYAIFTPLLSFFFLKYRFRKSYWVLLLIAMLGIFLLCDMSFNNFNFGDMMTLASAFFFSLHILAIDKYAKNTNPILFNFQQSFFMGILAVAFALIAEGPPILTPLLDVQNLFQASSLLGFVILSLFSSLVAFSFQVFAQQGTPPHIVSLVFLLESIFASIFGYVFFKESLSHTAIAGCILVLIAVSLIPKMTNFEKKSAVKP